ncbi:MAG: DUF4271 domain-containing protein [Cytophagales bacterium]|nr:DUF4271 domain-containing protein [Cytophagales bacterium]
MVVLLIFLTSQLPLTAEKDLRSDWQVYAGTAYVSVSDQDLDKVRTVYFSLHPAGNQGAYLRVRGSKPWQLFLNGKIIFSGTKEHAFRVDSLAAGGPQLFIGIHSVSGLRDVTTGLVAASSTNVLPPVPEARLPAFFLDYGILVSGFLILFFLALYRTNPQLTLDYFSFAKIFSASERNETQLASRITASANLLFYLFCALLTGFLLSAIFYSAGPFFQAARPLQITSLGAAFWTWLKLSLFILILLASKLIIVLFFSTLFNFRETMSFQFFNFLRFVLFTGMTLAILSLVYFVLRVEEPVHYERLVVLALWLLGTGSVVVLVKLMGRAGFSFFHLFSYLCVSEIIPLVIIIKIFF